MTKFLFDFSQEVWNSTYKYHSDNNVDDSQMRVAKDLASQEKDPKKWTQAFYDTLQDFKSVPGGRITSNAGTGLHGTTYINCFVDAPVVEDKDSIEGIFNALTRAAQILKSEGGYGCCISFVRPRGSFIHGVGVETPGAVQMLHLWDTMSTVITKGSGTKKKNKEGKNKIRKGAMMCTLHVEHGDIEEFITAKATPGVLSKFNMSVLCSDKFMLAVKNHDKWETWHPDTKFEKYKKEWDGDFRLWEDKGYPRNILKTYADANELWDLLMESTYNRNEPGILFIDRINDLNNLSVTERILATNPCIAGDTLVATADGRNHVSIRELAKSGEDVPVFCLDAKGSLTVRLMRHPRVTGRSQLIYDVTLDDGSKITCTGNHKLRLRTGEYVEVTNLKPGDSLKVMTKFHASFEDLFPSNSSSQDYMWVNNGQSTNHAEHRFIATFDQNAPIPKGSVVHHKDFNSLNNHPANLQIMTKKDHDDYHGFLVRGDNNPMRKAKKNWSKEQWEAYKGVSSPSFKTDGIKNSNYSGISKRELRRHARLLTKALGRRFGTQEWLEYAKQNNIVQQLGKWRLEELGGTLVGFSKWAALKEGIDPSLANLHPSTQKTYLQLSKQGYDCEIGLDRKIYVRKSCEVCKKELIVWSQRRENSIHAGECTRAYRRKLNQTPSFQAKATAGRQKVQQERNVQVRERQLEIFNELKYSLKEIPSQEIWSAKCKAESLASHIGPRAANFKKYNDLIEAAEMFNHKIVSIQVVAREDVYNGTVDEYHNFFIGGFESKTKNGKKKWCYVNNLQCGEQVLPPGGVCLLGSLNLTQFINKTRTDWDYDKLKINIPIFVRMLDNVNDRTLVPLPEQRENLDNKRRIGIGYLGYGSALYLLKERYGSASALKLTDELCSFVTNQCYQASSRLAKEKGSFPLFNKKDFLDSKFVQQALTKETIDLISKYGLRNSHLTSIQPTGNSSIYANNVSGGLEPVFMPEYVRTSIVQIPPDGLEIPLVDWEKSTYYIPSLAKAASRPALNEGDWEWTKEGDESLLKLIFESTVYKIDRNRGLTKETVVEDYGVHLLKTTNEWDPTAPWAVDTVSLSVAEHVNTMKSFAKYTDSAMSKTVNLPADYAYDDFKKLYMSLYDSGTIKGGTTYRAGTMTTVLAAKEEPTSTRTSPKRPKELDCDVHQLTVGGERWVVFVGLMDGKPYEVFAGLVDKVDLTKKITTGKIIKRARNKYSFVHEDLVEILDVTAAFDNSTQGAMTRLLSTSLRHGVEAKFLVTQLQKTGNGLNTFAKSIARTLKKYIQEGEKLTDTACPDCESKDIVMTEGCNKCMSCGYSGCS